MVYSKEVTAVILSDMARGASAEETQKHLQDLYGKAPHTNTIYTHRHSITAEQIVDELIRQQQRDITKEDNSDRRMYYRDKLLDKLMQLKIEIVSKNLNINKHEVTLNVSDLLKQYEDLFEEAALLEHCAPQPLHTSQPQTNNQTGTRPTT